MINRIMNENNCFKNWYQFVDLMNDQLNAAPLLKLIFLIGFQCTICERHVIELRVRPCYHITCDRCLPGYCSMECSISLIKTYEYLELWRSLEKKPSFDDFDFMMTIKIRPEGEIIVNFYQKKTQQLAKKMAVKSMI